MKISEKLWKNMKKYENLWNKLEIYGNFRKNENKMKNYEN